MDTILAGTGALRKLFDPISPETFLARTFESEPLHIERNDPRYFADLYDASEIEASLVLGARDSGRFALISAETGPLPPDAYTYSRPAVRARATGKAATVCLDPRKVAAYFEIGHTLVIKDAALFSRRLQRFCNSLEHALGSYVQPNVYFTPGSAQGFKVHHDTHDTLVAQIEGTKRWKIYAPVIELPLETQPFHSGTNVPGLRVINEVTLHPGDTLYLPHGYPHEAASNAERSLHVTFALLPMRAIDVPGFGGGLGGHAGPNPPFLNNPGLRRRRIRRDRSPT